MTTLRAHPKPEPIGVTFRSVFVVFVRDLQGLIGVWYHPNRAACEEIAKEWTGFSIEIVEYVRKEDAQ